VQQLNPSPQWPERAVCTNDKGKGRKAANPFRIQEDQQFCPIQLSSLKFRR